MTENLVYFSKAAEHGVLLWAGVIALRTGYSALMHASATSIAGAALGFAKYRRDGLRWLAPGVGLLGALGLHGVWNALLVLGAQGDAALGLLDLLAFPVVFATLLGIFQLCLVDERRIIERELEEEADRGVLPRDHVAALSIWRRRVRRGWLPPTVDHHAYVRDATTLAFRKSQERSLGRAPDGEEIRGLREALRRRLTGQADPT